mgnify:CR=1 FL=1
MRRSTLERPFSAERGLYSDDHEINKLIKETNLGSAQFIWMDLCDKAQSSTLKEDYDRAAEFAIGFKKKLNELQPGRRVTFELIGEKELLELAAQKNSKYRSFFKQDDRRHRSLGIK